MSLSIPYRNLTNAKEAFNTVKKLLTPEIVAKFQVKADLNYDEANLKIGAQGKGFSLNMEFLEDKAMVDLDVAFLLKALKGTILSKIEKMLKSVL